MKIGLIIALLINYGNQLHAAVEITEPTIDRHCKKERTRIFAKIGIRATVFISSGRLQNKIELVNAEFSYTHLSFVLGGLPLTVLVALITENLDLLMSLVGALTCTFLCLLFPPTLDIITFCHKPLGWFRLAKNVFIILMALVVFATGTLAAVMAFENYFEEDFIYHGTRVTF